MPVASNPLLQTASANPASTATGLLSSKTQEAAPTGAASFASVYSRQNQADYAQKADAAQAYADKLATAAANKSSSASALANSAPVVADSGKDLPVKQKQPVADSTPDASKADNAKVAGDKSAGKADNSNADSSKVDSSQGADQKVAAGKDEKADAAATDDTVATTEPATDPTVDPATLLAATPTDLAVALDPALTTAPAAVTPALDPTLAALVTPAPAPSVTDAAKGEGDDDFDPSADPLADLPAVRMALEHNAKAQGTTSAHAADPNQQNAQSADDAAAGLSTLIQQQAASEGKAGSGEQGLGAASSDEALKGIKGGIGEAATGNFADRLSALSQATGKSIGTAAAATPPASPLAMNQSGWTEGVVNRVMYLSSQNLKSADIQLSPAELGRLDIKVTMNNDQQTQVTFVSAHVGVREALESQQGRLKEMFAQQGLGQMDVNVSDQSRQQQSAQQQAQQTSRGSGGRLGRGDGVDSDDAIGEVSAAAHTTTLIGTSAVDYYA